MALQGITNCAKVVDDILLFDEDFQMHVRRIHQMLARCREHSITLNKDNFIVATSSVNFCGYTIITEGISLDANSHCHLRVPKAH